MSAEPTTAEAELLVALARGDAPLEDRRRAVELLTGNEPLRDFYRKLTDGKFPPIPNYTIIEQVGKGGFGVVYKAIHHATERLEALKVLFSKTPLLTSYFENEVHLIARLRHPNIATLYDAQLSTPPLYYSMDFVEGERLNDYLRGRGPTLAERIEIVRKVARAIGYAHLQGVIHRDIKPQNILIDAAHEPHIVDFGIARRLRLDAPPRMTESGTPEGPVGTLGYIAPEVVAGQRIDERVDVFALGALLFHCVTLEPARLARDPQHRMTLLRKRRVTHVDDLGAIIGKCTETQPDKRYPNCDALVADLDNYLAGRYVDARRAPSPARYAARFASLAIRNHPMSIRVALALVTAAVVALAFGAMRVNTVPSGAAPERDVVLVLFTDDTLNAIRNGTIGSDIAGLDPENYLTWRALHGRLMERLAAADPRVVAWDYYFEGKSNFDAEFAKGAQTLAKKGVPVVVGARYFNVNSEPVLTPAIRRAVHSWGSLASVDSDYLPLQFQILYAFRRGFEPPVPGLAVAVYAASRFPDCQAAYELDVAGKVLRIGYRRIATAAGESRFEPEGDELPFLDTYPVTRDQPITLPGALEKGDVTAHTCVNAETEAAWLARAIPYENVLTAAVPQLRQWFTNKVVMIAQRRPGIDMHRIYGDEWIAGCIVHAQALKALLENTPAGRQSTGFRFMNCLLWTLAAGVYVTVAAVRQWRTLRLATWVCAGLMLIGLCIPLLARMYAVDLWQLQLAISLSSLLVAGGAMYLLKAIRERQMQIAPAAIRPTDEETMESTMLAQRAP